MAINPEDITTVRIDQLSPEPITVTSLLPHQVGTDLKQGTIQELVDLVATAVGVSGGVGYLAISVTDGQQLPDVPENPSFFLCGAGTFLNINGYPNIICTENLNAIMSLTDHWELAVEIPINPLSGTVQSVTGSAVDNTDPLNPVINITPSSLQSVLEIGNETNGNDISISDGDAVMLDNGARFKKGTTDAGNGGAGGAALKCSVDYELKWEAGRLYVMEQDGFTIREVSYNFDIIPTTTDDDTKGFIIGSRWVLDDSSVYVCTDATEDNAVWELIESGVPTLQQVLDNNHDLINSNFYVGTNSGSTNIGNNVNSLGYAATFSNIGNHINALGSNSAESNTGDNVNAIGYNSANTNTGNEVNALGSNAGAYNTFDNVNLFGLNAEATANGQTVLSKDGTIMAIIDTTNLIDNRQYDLPDASGTIALTSDITGVIPKGTASGTDTYTSTITGVTAYTDGDAYLIRFINGNTTAATLNLNTLGAKSLYRNNDGALIGGDIWDGAEMLCVFNSTLDGFQCIGTSPNALFSYVTNADSVSITKGMPVYAFGGQGDRMTVKRANNSSDATSAQTVGIVASTSIAAGQKGIIIMQGLLDGLSILPTSTYSDGDAIYLGATAGAITKTKPYAPNHLVYLGVVTTASNGSAGRMYVRIQNGYEMDELHNVDAQSPNNNDGLFYNSTSLLWEHKNVLAVAAERRNANNSTNNNINYCGIAPADSAESASVWTITRLTITDAGAVTTATAINVKWTDRETATYT